MIRWFTVSWLCDPDKKFFTVGEISVSAENFVSIDKCLSGLPNHDTVTFTRRGTRDEGNARETREPIRGKRDEGGDTRKAKQGVEGSDTRVREGQARENVEPGHGSSLRVGIIRWKLNIFFLFSYRQYLPDDHLIFAGRRIVRAEETSIHQLSQQLGKPVLNN